MLAVIAGVDRPRAAGALVPRRVGGRPVHRPERRRRQRRRIRHEQVLPDHVDRGRDPGGVADPSLAAGRSSRRCCSCRALSPALIARLARALDRSWRSGCPRSGRRAGSRRTRRSARCSSPTPSSTARSTSPGGCGSRPSGRTSRTSATTRRRARRTRKAIYCDGPEVAAERMARYGATYVLSSGGNPCDGEPRDRLRVERPVRDGLRRRRRHGLAPRWTRPPVERRRQPLGSTTIVTSGVMPVKTLIATLYVPSVLSGSSRSILWRSTSMPRRASASAMSFEVMEP